MTIFLERFILGTGRLFTPYDPLPDTPEWLTDVPVLNPDTMQLKTAEASALLEDNPVLSRLFQGRCSLLQYRCILRLLHRFYSTTEQSLVQVGMGDRAGPLFYTHVKTPLLEADLDVLECAASDCPPDQGGDPSRLRVASPIEALGAWFILERAAFSWGRLNKLLKRRYGLDAATGLAFFTNYGNRLDFFWEDFLLFIQSQVFTEADADTFFRAAEKTARALDQFLREGFKTCTGSDASEAESLQESPRRSRPLPPPGHRTPPAASGGQRRRPTPPR